MDISGRINNVSDALTSWSSSERSWVVRNVAAPVVYAIASEALAIVGMVYHLLATAVKAIPATVMLITGLKLGNLDWVSIYHDHLAPLGSACKAVMAAPLQSLRSGDLGLALETMTAQVWHLELSLSRSRNIAPQDILLEPMSEVSITEVLQELQGKIKDGDLDYVRALDCPASLLNRPLPNSELPLHFAVLSGQRDIALALMERGADIGVQDDQKLTALDHAALLKDERMLDALVAHLCALDTETAHELRQRKVKPEYVAEVLHFQEQIEGFFGDLDHTDKLAEKCACPLGQAAYRGDIAELRRLGNKEINTVDETGATPLHWAIMGKSGEAVDTLIGMGAKVSVDGAVSALRMAVQLRSPQIVAKLLAAGADPDARYEGIKPMMMACALGDFASIKVLIKGGADPRLCTLSGESPLALLGADAAKRDPLASSSLHKLLAITTLAAGGLLGLWRHAISNPGISDRDLTRIRESTAAAMELMDLANCCVSIKDISPLSKWEDNSVFKYGTLFAQLIPALNKFIWPWKALHVGRAAAVGMGKAWRYAGSRPGAAILHGAVHGVGLLSLLGTFVSRHMLFNKISPVRYPEKVDWLNAKELDPERVEDAAEMILPGSTLAQIKEMGAQGIRKVCRQLARDVHPDKHIREDLRRYSEAFERMNTARDTLINYVRGE